MAATIIAVVCKMHAKGDPSMGRRPTEHTVANSDAKR
jgi:hypothetical protein